MPRVLVQTVGPEKFISHLQSWEGLTLVRVDVSPSTQFDPVLADYFAVTHRHVVACALLERGLNVPSREWFQEHFGFDPHDGYYLRLSTRDPQQIPDTQAGRGWSTGDHGAVSTAC